MHAHLLTCASTVRFLGRKSVLPCAACLHEVVPTRVHVCSRLPLCARNSAKEFWTHVKSFHVLWGCRPRACSQQELKAQQGHLSLDSTPIVLSFLPAMFQRETLKRCKGRRKEQGRGRGHSLLSFTSARRYFDNDRSWKLTVKAQQSNGWLNSDLQCVSRLEGYWC